VKTAVARLGHGKPAVPTGRSGARPWHAVRMEGATTAHTFLGANRCGREGAWPNVVLRAAATYGHCHRRRTGLRRACGMRRA
jgi:hypothetical protein